MMKSFTLLFLAVLPWIQCTAAQDDTVNYTDRASGIVFNTWATSNRMTFGMALPSNALTTDATEFIGIITCASPNGQGTGWCGVSLGGGMNDNLLLLAYPQEGKVLTSFRWAENYALPFLYTGNARLTQVSSTVNATHYSLIFRCQNCLKWQQGASEVGGAPSSEGYMVLGWCYATASPANGACPNTLSVRQHNSQGIFAARFNDAVANPSYSAWAAKATSVVAGSCGGGRPTAVPSIVTSVTTLRPPTVVPTPPANSCAKTYTVQSGDYCYLIATNNGLSLDQLYSINPGLSCSPLQIGVVVCVKRS